MKPILLSLLFLLPLLASAQCSMEEYKTLLNEAKAAQKKGQYDSTFYKLFSARVCRPEKEEVVNKLIVEVFKDVNQQRVLAVKNAEEARRQRDTATVEREKAEQRARENYANDLASKSIIALRDGNRSLAFRLAEFANQFVDTTNPRVTQALFNAVYYNDRPDISQELPWQQMTLEGHNSAVSCVTFSPDGNFLATGDGEYLILGHSNHIAKIWDLKTGECKQTLEGHTNGITGIAFFPGGDYLVTGSADSTAKIWEIATGKCALTIKNTDRINQVALSPNGENLIIGSMDGTIKTWDTKTGYCKQTIDCCQYSVSRISLSDDGVYVALVCDTVVKILNLITGQYEHSFSGHNDIISGLAFSPNGNQLASVSHDKTAKIWDFKSGQCVQTFSAHKSWVMSVAFSLDGEHLVTGSADKSAKIWNLNTGECELTLMHKYAVWSVAFSPNKSLLATGSGDYTTKIWDLKIDKYISTLKGHSYEVTSVDFSPNCNLLAAGSWDGTAKIWDLKSEQYLHTFSDSFWVYSVKFSPDGNYLATGSDNSTARIWDLRTGNCIRVFRSDADSMLDFEKVYSVAFSPDGNFLATGFGEIVLGLSESGHTAKIWDMKTGQCIQTLIGHRLSISSLAFSPNGKLLATGSDDHTAKIWDIKTGQCVRTMFGHTGPVFSVAFSPDGNQLVTGSSDRTVKVWDIKGSTFNYYSLNTSGTNSIAFLPGCDWIVTGSNENTVEIWDLKTKQCLNTFIGHSDRVVSVAFSPDGRYIASGSWDKTVKIWSFDPSVLINIAHKKNLAWLTADELQEYGMEVLLDQHPNNEARLCQMKETWQIAAFADLYANKIRQTGFPKKEDYERALRLYDHCVKSGEAPEYFEQRVAELKKVWKEKTE